MISRIEGWSWDVHAGAVTLRPHRGPTWGVIRYRERLHPLRSLSQILAGKPDIDFTITRTGPVTPIITDEGEYAAVIDFEGTTRGEPVQRTLGVVFGDDWYSEIAAIAYGRDSFSMFAGTVRELVRAERLLLGVRRRRYSYTPPPGWHGYSRLPLFTTWFPPEFPKLPASISIYPAIPATRRGEPGFDQLTLGPVAPADIVRPLSGRSPLSLESGLVGAGWDFEIRDEAGRALVRRVVLLRDDQYVYTGHLDTPADHVERLAATWRALVESIRPLPIARASSDVHLFQHVYHE